MSELLDSTGGPGRSGSRAGRRDFPRAFHWLEKTQAASGSGCFHWGAGRASHWPAVLPEDRETLATWLPTEVADGDRRDGAWWLPVIAEAGGPAGAATHLAPAYGLAARHSQDRLSAVDALPVRAAGGQLDARELGKNMATPAISGTVKLNRVVDAARTAATGAYGTAWSVLSATLPDLLASGTPRPALGELLPVAADCVERSGAAGGIPALAAFAGRGGTSQVTTQAVRLLNALRL